MIKIDFYIFNMPIPTDSIIRRVVNFGLTTTKYPEDIRKFF